MAKEICDCGVMATWCYMPSYSDNENPYHCDTCVPRGCTCNWNTMKNEGQLLPTEDKPWKWITRDESSEYGVIKEGEIWVHLDEHGREWPCVEYSHNETGFDFGDEEPEYNEDEFER